MYWINCPLHWPKDGHTQFRYADVPFNYKSTSIENQMGDLKINDLDKPGIDKHLNCIYGGQNDKINNMKYLILELPNPTIQCGMHDVMGGRTVGCRTLKTDIPHPQPQPIFPEIINAHTKLEGLGFGLTQAQVKVFAKQNGYSLHYWPSNDAINPTTDFRYGLYKSGIVLEVVFTPTSKLSSEIIVMAGSLDQDDVDLHRKAVKRFGFQYVERHSENILCPCGPNKEIITVDSVLKEIWTSKDEKISVEFWHNLLPKASASLHLIDRRQ
jgi:hypothetical protein